MNGFETTIVIEPASTVRAMARQVLRGRWLEALQVVLVMYAITTLPSIIIPYVSPTTFAISAVNTYTFVISGPAALGMCAYYLNVFREKPSGTADFLRGFNFSGKAIVLFVVIVVRVFVLSLLLIIPGIWAALRYSQSFFILADDPSKSVRQCLWESSLLMRGNLAKLFWLELSFIGWAFLASLPPGIGQMAKGAANTTVLLPSVFGIRDVARVWLEGVSKPLHPLFALLGLGSLLLSIYMGTAHACFYDLTNGNLRVHRVENIQEVQENE